MITHIDWLSFTFGVGQDDDRRSDQMQRVVEEQLRAQLGTSVQLIFDGQDWTPRSGRAPYSLSWQRADGGMTIFCHPALPHALVEISGKGCEYLAADMEAGQFLEAVSGTLTRLDLACDMLTETRPHYFIQHREAGRFKAWSEVVSESGHTIYVGSKQSDRYARVYRYNDPHPRAHLLRSEFVLKAEQARLAAKAILTDGLDSYAAAIGNTFGWTHPDWKPAVQTDAEAAAWRPERRQGKTVRWVYSQVLPSLLRLHADGALDLREFWEQNILPQLDKADDSPLH